jgi:hypothetical protein
MKSRNREVNIFNMSLLDILCGTLGAFCFLMLALLPDHIKEQLQEQIARMSTPEGKDAEARAKQAEEEAREAKQRAEEAEEKARKARAQQSLAYFQVAWNGPQDIDLWLKMPDKKWVLAKKALVPKEQFYAEVGDITKGPAREQAWLTDIAYSGDVYELHAKLQSANGSEGRVQVTGYIAVRVATGETTNNMTMYDLPAEFQREGELVMLGTLTFPSSTQYKVTVGPPQPQQSQQPPSVTPAPAPAAKPASQPQPQPQPQPRRP